MAIAATGRSVWHDARPVTENAPRGLTANCGMLDDPTGAASVVFRSATG